MLSKTTELAALNALLADELDGTALQHIARRAADLAKSIDGVVDAVYIVTPGNGAPTRRLRR